MNKISNILLGFGFFFFGCCLVTIFTGAALNGGLFAVATAVCFAASAEHPKDMGYPIIVIFILAFTGWVAHAIITFKYETVTATEANTNKDVLEVDNMLQQVFDQALSNLRQNKEKRVCLNGFLYNVLEDGSLKGVYDMQPAGDNKLRTCNQNNKE
ncbi:hypothetical protein RJY75_26245 [Escherichia coli]|uniref:hypothetical protein n=1 Tax=Escherichia coli TaxID=562 RepID=UPI00287A83A2|nr:hypothetical protein [Escherichia coli]MDS4101221.1 hypothetical protein [Escherichia coli]